MRQDLYRGTGRTTRQLKEAPTGAIYICLGGSQSHKRLAMELGRPDLRLERPEWLAHSNWRGLRLTGIVIDHAVELTDEQYANYVEASMRIRK